MREWYIKSDEIDYECPYCHCEITDCTGKPLKTREEYCINCGKEFRLVIEEQIRKVNNMKKFTKQEIQILGEDIASLWGGKFLEYKFNEETQKHEFYCEEHEEYFYSAFTQEELEERLNYFENI